MTAISPIQPVTLANCEDEPIQSPGAIQPHGALLAFDPQGLLLSQSTNFGTLTGIELQPGEPLAAIQLGDAVLTLLEEGLGADAAWTDSTEASLGDQLFDVIGHTHQGVYYLEFEPRHAATTSFSQFALYAQRVISHMQRRSDIFDLLASVTREIRQLTGFDRVMAYRFRPDLSGEVVAEERREDLESYLGQRYPASDIPAQARRLYILNPIRLIADVAYQPIPLVPAISPLSGQAFDLSFCNLRSVSPIHCEYLSNMGVKASMSVSIVVAGKLWGLFSCHHMTAKTMPHPIRMSFQVISQVASALVDRLELNHTTEVLHRASELSTALVRRVRDAEDLLAGLISNAQSVVDLLPCNGAAIALGGRIYSIGGTLDAHARAVIEHLQTQPNQELFQTDTWPGAISESEDGIYCGILAVRFHAQESGWIIWLRKEEISNVRWGGKPDKIIKVGPFGSRLTPRGSFEAWEEIVRGRAPAWTDTDRLIAEKLRSELVELCLSRAGQIDSMRQKLIAMLGHDLRNPLQSISMAASMLKSNEKRDTELRKHISHSSGRMERLISQVLEMSRLQTGQGITVNRHEVDISELVTAIITETSVAFPDLILEMAIEPDINGLVDPDRYAQIVTNLLGNARYHGTTGKPVLIRLNAGEHQVKLSILNEAAPIATDRLQGLFQPFRPQHIEPGRNKDGLGIGLYISQSIAVAHGGYISVEQHSRIITFSVTVPRH